MALRNQTPGLPDVHTGVCVKDPMPITDIFVNDVLVGWMSLAQIAAAMRLTTAEARIILCDFMRKFPSRENNGIREWSKFSGVTKGGPAPQGNA